MVRHLEHGTPEGYAAGCKRSERCPALLVHGLSCEIAHIRHVSGERRYAALYARGLTSAQIAARLGFTAAAGIRATIPDKARVPPQHETEPTMPEPQTPAAAVPAPMPFPKPPAPRMLTTAPYEVGLNTTQKQALRREVRAWCRDAGYEVGTAGHIPQDAIAAYIAAHPLDVDDQHPVTETEAAEIVAAAAEPAEESWPANDGRRVDRDPTNGRIDKDIQEQVDQMHASIGQRVVLEQTFQEQRDALRSDAAASVALDQPGDHEGHTHSYLEATTNLDPDTGEPAEAEAAWGDFGPRSELLAETRERIAAAIFEHDAPPRDGDTTARAVAAAHKFWALDVHVNLGGDAGDVPEDVNSYEWWLQLMAKVTAREALLREAEAAAVEQERRADIVTSTITVCGEVQDARVAAHRKHGERSQESLPHDAPDWLPILMEEVGEVATELTYDATGDLRAELIDVIAVATAWVSAIDKAADEGHGAVPADPPPLLGCRSHPAGTTEECGPCATVREQRLEWIGREAFRKAQLDG